MPRDGLPAPDPLASPEDWVLHWPMTPHRRFSGALQAARHPVAHCLLLTLLGLAVCVLGGLPAGSGAASAAGHARYQSPRADAGAATAHRSLVGVGDEQTSMFA